MKFFTKNKNFIIAILALGVFFWIVNWLIDSYQPPIPPRWIGIQHYRYDVTNKAIEKSSVPTGLEAIQTAIVVVSPNSPEARALLPAKIPFVTFTLTDTEVLKTLLTRAIARSLVGVPAEKAEQAVEILKNPDDAVRLTQLYIVVTDSNNLSKRDLRINDRLRSIAQKINPAEYEKVERSIVRVPLVPRAEKEGQESHTFQISKKGMYRVAPIDNSESFIIIDGVFVPVLDGKTTLLSLDSGTHYSNKPLRVTPATYYLAIHTIEGIPFNFKSIGHGWLSLSRKEFGKLQPIMTMSLFNSIDTDKRQNVSLEELTNIATYTNLWINHPHDWERSGKLLNGIAIPEGPTRTKMVEIPPEKAYEILYLRKWYTPKYSTQQVYEAYLQNTFGNAGNILNRLALFLEFAHVKIQDVLNMTFWRAIQAWINGTRADTRYNGITSNCVAYTADTWNRLAGTPRYNPRILGIVPAPGHLFQLMNTEDIIDLPDATKLQ